MGWWSHRLSVPSLPGQSCQGPSPGSSSPATWLSEQGPVPPLRPLLLACGSGTGRPQLALCALIASPPAAELLTYTPRTNSTIRPYVPRTHMNSVLVFLCMLTLLFASRTHSPVLSSHRRVQTHPFCLCNLNTL